MPLVFHGVLPRLAIDKIADVIASSLETSIIARVSYLPRAKYRNESLSNLPHAFSTVDLVELPLPSVCQMFATYFVLA